MSLDRAKRAASRGYVHIGARSKLNRECPTCGAKRGWRCRTTRSTGDGMTEQVPIKTFHRER